MTKLRSLESFDLISLAVIEREYEPGIGRHWFDADTMRFFKTRLPVTAWLSDDGRRAYFISSDHRWGDKHRTFRIRWFDRDYRDMNTHGETGDCYDTRSQAESALRRVLNSEPQQRVFIAQAWRLPDDEIRRHAWVATANGPFSYDDESFTTACEIVRQRKHLRPLHWTWKEVDESLYWEMLGAVPPAVQDWRGFLVGEAMSAHNGAETFNAFIQHNGRFYKCETPLTVAEFLAVNPETEL